MLLRPSEQGTGTAVSGPLLFVLEITNLNAGEVIRVGDGSASEYRKVTALGAGSVHVSLDLPLQLAHASGVAVKHVVRAADAAFAGGGAFALVAATTPGATQITVSTANAGDLATLVGLVPGATFLIEIGTLPTAEYVLVTAASALSATQALVTLATPLQRAHGLPTTVSALSRAAAAGLETLALAARGGDSLVFVASPAGYVQPELAIIDQGAGVNEEVRRIGELDFLSIDPSPYEAYSAGSFVERVTMADSDASGPRALTAAAADGAVVISLDKRQGLVVGDVIRINAGAGVAEFLTIRDIPEPRSVTPDAGTVIVDSPLRRSHAVGAAVVRQGAPVVELTAPPTMVLLDTATDATSLLVTDGAAYALNNNLRVTTPSGAVHYHRMSAAKVVAAPREVTLGTALSRSHANGSTIAERQALLTARALDAGAWGNRVLVSANSETTGLLARAEVTAATPSPGPGIPSTLKLTTLTGVEAGTVLELRDADDVAQVSTLLKVRSVDRAAGNLVVLDPPGLTAAHVAAFAAAAGLGRRLVARSREFRLDVLVLVQPSPAVPSRDTDILDGESFRNLSMDQRHSRYVERVIGSTFTDGAASDDLGRPVRRSDRRSEGASEYVRVHDLGASDADRERVRLGPEVLWDILPSGQRRAARLRLGEGEDTARRGDDSVATMGDAMYLGADNIEPEKRTGIFALKNLNTVSLVAAPGQTTPAVQQALIDHCEEQRYRFAVIDAQGPDDDTLADVQAQRQQFDTKYAALYHPWVTIPDPFPSSLSNIPQFPVPPSGHVLGIYAPLR